jgi:TfoX/Sxy family transcriptional regulator of competence genes
MEKEEVDEDHGPGPEEPGAGERMSYDEGLADRIRTAIARLAPKPVTEKKMFGGIAFMVDDKMCVGVVKDDLMVRVGPDRHESALAEPGARVMDFNHRPMVGFLFVGLDGQRSEGDLAKWLRWSIEYVDSVPAKSAKTKKKK